MNQVMKQFAMETEKMGMQQEMMQDQFDMMADPDQENQAEEVYSQILGEIGMSMNSEMNAKDDKIVVPEPAKQDDDL